MAIMTISARMLVKPGTQAPWAALAPASVLALSALGRERRHILGTITMETQSKSAPEAKKPVWLITGCSTGFGHELAKHVIERGFRTVVTSRNLDDIKQFANSKDTLTLKLDVTDALQIQDAVAAATEKFGCIDVLVNNAGIGYFGAVEESEDAEVRKMFEINVFGLGNMIRAVLPGMRQRHSGAVINFSSIGGICSFPGLGYYSATKFALEGLSEALWQEVEPLGIKVMLVEPSGFRTDWAGRSAHESKHQIADYDLTAGASRKQIRAASGKQAGDPVRAAKAVVDAIESGNPPHHLLLGNDAFDAACAKLEKLRKEFMAGEKIARAADYT